jgi:hypothetical protein
MAVKSTLKAELESIYSQMDASPMSNSDYADKLSTAIDNYIKTFKVDSGIKVTIPSTSSPGSPSAGSTDSQGTLS